MRAQREIFTRRTLTRIFYWDYEKKTMIRRIDLMALITFAYFTDSTVFYIFSQFADSDCR